MCIGFKDSGLFYQVNGENAILLSYLFNLDIKNGLVYVSKNKIDKVLLVLDKLNINYIFKSSYHKFNNNKYDYYLDYAYKKYDIKGIIDSVYD